MNIPIRELKDELKRNTEECKKYIRLTIQLFQNPLWDYFQNL